MSWSEIKHAVNSTLGTSDFKPLDKYIESLISVNPTSDVIARAYGSRTSTTTTYEVLAEQTMKYSGTIRIEAISTKYQADRAAPRGRIYVRKNGVQDSGTAVSDGNSANKLIAVKAGDTIQVEGVVYESSTAYGHIEFTVYGGVTLGKVFR